MMKTSSLTLDRLVKLLEDTPVIAELHPVSLCFMPSNVKVMESTAEAAWLIDTPNPTLPTHLLIIKDDPLYRGRFPHVRCVHDPFAPALNSILFERFDDITTRMLCQSQVADRIVTEAGQAQVIILFLVDGLAYARVRTNFSKSNLAQPIRLEPCLVDVPTLTHIAFPNLIGDPSLAVRLFDVGFHHRLGFSYWTREDNTLTDRIFQGLPHVEKESQFSKILETLRDFLTRLAEEKAFVQILRTGLDGYAHAQKRCPPVEAIVSDVWSEFCEVVAMCQSLRLATRLYLTADHGILWRDEFEPEIVGIVPASSSPRYSNWRELYLQEEQGRRFVWEDEELYCLGFPKLRRPLHIDEQGVHGGISFQESVVPFVTVEVHPEE